MVISPKPVSNRITIDLIELMKQSKWSSYFPRGTEDTNLSDLSFGMDISGGKQGSVKIRHSIRLEDNSANTALELRPYQSQGGAIKGRFGTIKEFPRSALFSAKIGFC